MNRLLTTLKYFLAREPILSRILILALVCFFCRFVPHWYYQLAADVAAALIIGVMIRGKVRPL